MTMINRDPFAREELHREVVKTNKTCDWCGNNYKGKLYQYRIETDGGTKSEIKGMFCQIGCLRSYHNC